jgi:hypothetical protein
VLLQSFDSVPPDPYLDSLICAWREKEKDTLENCPRGVRSSAVPSYPACRSKGKRKLRTTTTNHKRKHFQNAFDVLLYNDLYEGHPNHTEIKISMDPSNWEEPEDKNWNAWIEEQSQQMKYEEEIFQELKEEILNQDIESPSRNNDSFNYHIHDLYHRKLDDRTAWADYWPMLGCRTEVS